MPHKRSPEAKAKRMEAATLHVALQHARKRELDVGAREERVGRRERNAPELNDKLLALHLETRGLLQRPPTSPAIISPTSTARKHGGW